MLNASEVSTVRDSLPSWRCTRDLPFRSPSATNVLETDGVDERAAPPGDMADELRQLERLAFDGFTPAAQARILALHCVGDYAGVWVGTTDETGQGDQIVIAERRDGRWSELTSSSACTTWSSFRGAPNSNEEGRQLGVLAVLGQVGAPSVVRVQCGEAAVTVTSRGQHYVAVFVGVGSDACHDVRISAGAGGGVSDDDQTAEFSEGDDHYEPLSSLELARKNARYVTAGAPITGGILGAGFHIQDGPLSMAAHAAIGAAVLIVMGRAYVWASVRWLSRR